MIMRMLVFAACLLGMAGIPAKAAMPFNQWACFDTVDALFDSSFGDGTYRVNNISIAVRDDVIAGARTIALSASASNRGAERTAFSVEVVAIGEAGLEAPIFSISARPSFGAVEAMKTEEIRGSIVKTLPGPGSVVKACIRVAHAAK